MSTILSKIYSRERALFDFYFWDESDRLGIRTYLGEELKTGVRIIPPRGQKGEVWYSNEEIERISGIAIARLNANPGLVSQIISDAERAWVGIEPYVEKGKRLESVPEMLAFYQNLLVFWAALNTVFFELPNYPNINEYFRSEVLRIREKTQEYTETMSERFVEYLDEFYAPIVGDASYYVSPLDVTHFSQQAEVAELASVIRDRAENGCFIIEGKIFPMREMEREFKRYGFELETIQTQTISEVRGTPAFRGIATGRARIINSLADLHRVQDGDVLVTQMTIPEYVPSLKKTVAFVTDEGGITCHAAIVARELKKPCVIGTKFATQIFKDDDMVEVDAEKGVVKLLERAK